MGKEPIMDLADGGVSRRRVLLGTAGTGFGGLAGCLTRGEDSGLEGEIVIDGSNTLLPNSALVAELFMWENNQVRISVSGSGTGAGFQQFCRGEADLQNASRRIGDGERTLCEGNGVDWLELEVVMDGIAIIKHPDNTWCDQLTVDELGQMWERGSDVETWADLDDDWPGEEISFYGRDAASGTYDYFTEQITGAVGNIRNDFSGSPDTNNIVRGVRGNEHAIGFAGAGYYEENEDDLEVVEIYNGDEYASPSPETIEASEQAPEDRTVEPYEPLSRPLYLYVREDALERPAFREFVRFYLETTQETARDVGFYAVPDETIEEQRERLEDAIERYV
ncbi:PstS family phosphate ABC transporter substrate-binding protein [Natronobacterium gregoryi]|uniref:ABC-type phosphate transport system, periplasmic component n=2 Tax=Natronobacterium gregoryi TaxID=44930 RepID=L0ADW9_NATGS|nr:PstS family phosphate ABC transporter substrate-binding protein [Natronobacterium gregoryi]AFZ71609.1 ABC-type phosphate transport system, periplasmic component [Natronobacterium gregoryi SP2]ELY66664.1 phosphate ABC transporter substrate-binding protein [Natronobacterium gregoryi SP2]PLK21376.1 phosphate ABC transporter substrate-binding protein [Natronobacterium gregoryi SP2]SFI80575.1 phosphate ABC transporter substrate-binding protein, PhoT family [Natronobacterium gregoryi]